MYSKLRATIRAALLVSLIARAAVAYADQVCTVQEAAGRLAMFAVTSNAERAKKIMPVLQEMQNAEFNVSNPNLPIGDQLSPEARARYETLSFQVLVSNLNKLFADNLHRDADVLANVIRIHQAIHAGRPTPANGSPDDKYMKIAALIDVGITKPVWGNSGTATAANGCSMVDAISAQRDEVFQRPNVIALNNVATEIKAMQAKYGAGWPQNLPVGPIRSRGLELAALLDRAKPDVDFMNSLGKIMLVQQMSDRKYDIFRRTLNRAKSKDDVDKMQDLVETVADPSNEDQKTAVGILEIITAQYPSRAMQDMMMINDALAKTGEVPQQ